VKLTLEQLKTLAREKADEATALVEKDEPTAEDMTKADGLMEASEGYTKRAELMEKARTLVEKNEVKEPEPEAKAASEPSVTVVEDEADKLVRAKPFKGLGEFLLAVVHDRDHRDQRLGPLASTDPLDEGGYNVGKAIGYDKIGSLYDARVAQQEKAISGISETVPADGGILVQTDTNLNIISRMYNVGQLLQRVAMTPIGPNSNGLTLFAEDETSRATGSRRGGIRFYWASEGDLFTGSKPKFCRRVGFRGRRMAPCTIARF